MLLETIPIWLRLMMLGALWFSMAQVLIKTLGQTLPFMEIVFFRGLWGVGLSLFMMRRAGVAGAGRRKGLLLTRGLLGFLTMSGSFYSLTVLSLSDAITLYYLHPVFAAVFSSMLGRERFFGRTALALVISLAGALCIARPAFLFGLNGPAPDPLGVAAALVSAVCGGAVLVSLHELGRTEHPLVPTLWVSVCAVSLSLAGALPVWRWPVGWEWLLIAGIGVLTQRAQLDMTRGLAIEPAGRASVVGYSQIILAGIWGAALFAETPHWSFYPGAALIILGSLVSTFGAKKPAPVKPIACTTVRPPSESDDHKPQP
ncbi:protein of unknown function DUF6 transmembrane [Alkalidesulfovibrio alkalitolerans DSM 16529]|uniref:EamA domain-containing protein n=1 Tax=Alkalidesulfovibrio alkalitolerans DSM 16529 TaxID=1121439 RepID=S7UGW7_9BACT|nr:DMT family transporter [Alkalidesulfovibrio alkalitolerans]EPR31488.1 protein of unknown function DUF6 transmembrane [Alkalidesulfovibrio alkalitolerans DSM 16529]